MCVNGSNQEEQGQHTYQYMQLIENRNNRNKRLRGREMSEGRPVWRRQEGIAGSRELGDGREETAAPRRAPHMRVLVRRRPTAPRPSTSPAAATLQRTEQLISCRAGVAVRMS